MKRYWQPIAARIDEMTLRQRGMLFATISLALVMLAHVALIEPILVRQKSLIDRVNRDQSQLAAVRTQLQAVLKEQEAGTQDPEQVELAKLEARIAAAEKSLAERKRGFIAPARLPVLLKDLLGPGQNVRLESLRVVPGAPVEASNELYRHGVELSLRGGYFDLAQYLAGLEKLPVRLLWGRMELQVEQYPEVRLILQVNTVSSQRALGL
jgi:MSHA biogenesis protein MshJ